MTRAKMNINVRAFEDKKEMTRHKINNGDNIYRILPPFGEQADGYPYKRWTLAWLVDPQSGNRRPFSSPWSFGHTECPAGEYARLLQDKRDDLEKKLAAKDMDKNEIKEYLKPVSEALSAIKPKSSFFYNASNKAGQVGVLELKKSAHDGLKKILSQYINDYNCDPTSLNSESDDSGLWVKITRTGTHFDTEYSVEKNQSKVKDPETGKIRFEDDQAELSAGIVENYESLATDLFKLYREVSYDILKEVVLFNLAQLHATFVKDFGEKKANLIIVPGFEFDELAEVEPAKKPEVKPVAAKTVKVMPKFNDEDDEEEFVAPKKTTRTPPPFLDDEDLDIQVKPTAKKSTSKTSVFDLADDILS